MFTTEHVKAEAAVVIIILVRSVPTTMQTQTTTKSVDVCEY